MVTKKREEGWGRLFDDKVDLTKDLNLISTATIRNYVGEVRLATKMDCREQLPPVFRDNGVFLLPLKNQGDFAVVKGDGFHDIEPIGTIKDFVSKLKLELVSLSGRKSEMSYLDYAYNTGLIEKFLGIAGLRQTIRGREFSKAFSFKVGRTEIDVTSVQIEVDVGYESPEESSIVLFEAKVGKKWSNFNIRQLYYPLRSYLEKFPQLEYRTVFFIYDSGKDTYNFWDYRFGDMNQYNSLKLRKKAAYRVSKADRTLSALDVLKARVGTTKVTTELDIPQADDFQKISEFPFKVKSGIDNSKKMAEAFAFTTRQSSYYRQATEFLGLVRMRQKKYELTGLGKRYINYKTDKRNTLLCSLLFKMPVIEMIARQLIENNRITSSEIAELINQKTKYNLTTSKRRTKTIVSWFKWLEKSLGIVKVNKTAIELVE